MKFPFILIALAVVSAALFTSCGGDDDAVPSPAPGRDVAITIHICTAPTVGPQTPTPLVCDIGERGTVTVQSGAYSNSQQWATTTSRTIAFTGVPAGEYEVTIEKAAGIGGGQTCSIRAATDAITVTLRSCSIR